MQRVAGQVVVLGAYVVKCMRSRVVIFQSNVSFSMSAVSWCSLSVHSNPLVTELHTQCLVHPRAIIKLGSTTSFTHCASFRSRSMKVQCSAGFFWVFMVFQFLRVHSKATSRSVIIQSSIWWLYMLKLLVQVVPHFLSFPVGVEVSIGTAEWWECGGWQSTDRLSSGHGTPCILASRSEPLL